MAHSRFHQQPRDPVLHLNHLAHQQMPIAQGTAPIPNLGGSHVAFRQEVAAQAVGDLAGIDPIVLLFRRGDRTQHQWVRYLHLLGVRKQVIIDPPGEDRRLHRHDPWLRKSLYPQIQFPACCSDRPFPVNLATRILYAVANRLLVNIQSDVIHNVS
jgi:hypothetical protein